MGGSLPYRVGHAGGKHKKRATDTCSTGGFYISPAKGAVVDSLEPTTISWDSSCLDADDVDIHLYAPSLASPKIYVWESVTNSLGTYNATLKPRWWNDTSPIQLQLAILPSGDAPFLATLPAGPLWNATYTEPSTGVPDSADTSLTDSGSEVVGSLSGGNKSSSMSAGKIAAAVIVPLLFVGLCVAAWIKWQRMKGQEKRKRFSEAVDKRMSTISQDWKSLSAAGASAAIRNSIAVSGTGSGGNRASSFSFGGIRPSSTYTTDGGQAGVGTSFYNQENTSVGPEMSQFRRPNSSFTSADRVSRVSFAEGTRPSGEVRRSTVGQSRAFHHSFVPPIPTQKDSDERLSDGSMSPTQTAGPESLTIEAIRARVANGDISVRASMDEELSPAISMIRSISQADSATYVASDADPGDIGSQFIVPPPAAKVHDDHYGELHNETLFDATSDTPNPFSATNTISFPSSHTPSNGMFSGFSSSPSNTMSPDDMLRAYAERRKTNGSPTVMIPGGVQYPSAAAARTLVPAGPGAMSPSRGAYGATWEDDNNSGKTM
ncbi:uncharacterized protein BT62DRAFT_986106 [Guyanagaster necrorhizus]|uniref:Uncharacterized protein n=1 Tax=Guyanagaster necrorhizus TaxID=856835 RepID=A0A9P7VW61_9AGAR|nr:uncharacterized protein BT62DRAFT_986106 [Guyanagaster necrorhizus MCA 3950]KAG7448007.1 hypothetical protein BT62DRAFT_986106 [Guyanagaster necrorhizus MCA 3950]